MEEVNGEHMREEAKRSENTFRAENIAAFNILCLF